ncbi:MAG: PEP-CTERM system histidine kinase PrsK [Telmatospirillum sp.]|nr:PEP-CTERM system histidine kinase PrsK [Telmatospirillum sp.]
MGIRPGARWADSAPPDRYRPGIPGVTDIVGTAIFGVSAVVYLAIAAIATAARVKALKRWYFVAACLLTALWAALTALPETVDLPVLMTDIAEMAANVSWISFLLTLWGRLDDHEGAPPRRVLASRAFLPLLVIILLVVLPYFYNQGSPSHALLILLSLVNIILPVIGLLLIENLLRTSGPAGRWEIKHLCLGLGTVLTFGFFLRSAILVEGHVEDGLIVADGLVYLLVAPLILSSFQRLKNWKLQPEVKIIASPKPALYTVVLIASGCYLLLMSALSYYVHDIGGKWGISFQVTLMVGALLAMLVSLTSSKIKSHIKVLVLKTFFTYRYDYREEWLRFIQIVSAQQPSSLEFRLVRAIADLMDSPAGGLWVLQPADRCFFVEATWNLAQPHPPVRADDSLIAFFRRTCRIIDIDEYRQSPERYGDLRLPEWLTGRTSVWLIAPLIHRNDIIGFFVLDQARASHRLDWEDRDLLSTAAIQAASYLAEELTSEELRSARRLEDFNRQFAFVVHDIKNVVGQMSLMLENAKKYGDNPDFQKDMLETVGNSVTRMRAMLEQLAAQRRQPLTPGALELVGILSGVADQWQRTAPNLTVNLPPGPVGAMGIETTLKSVLDLLIDNALSAVGPQGSVELRLRSDGEKLIIEVADNGPGMDENFVQKELFRPLASTKSTGYGIGAYQTRHLVREMGGELEVDTAPQRGTTMRIVMPAAQRPTVGDPQVPVEESREG